MNSRSVLWSTTYYYIATLQEEYGACLERPCSCLANLKVHLQTTTQVVVGVVQAHYLPQLQFFHLHTTTLVVEEWI